MSKASQARRIATNALYGGGGVVGAGLSAYGLLALEAKLARRRIGQQTAEPYVVDGDYGAGAGEPIRLAMLGDSTGAGLGAEQPEDTPAVVIAQGLAAAAGRRVTLRNVSVVGAETSHLPEQVVRLADFRPDVAVITVGANDVTHTVPPATSVRNLDEAIRDLRDGGAAIVVGTCPDLGTIRTIHAPLRHVARRWSRRLAAAQMIAVVEAGGRAVSLGDILGPEFHANPGEYFSADRFHPSSVGYIRCGEVLLPSVLAACGVGDGIASGASGLRTEAVLPVASAAAAAAEEAGTVIEGAEVAGEARSSRGRWAALRVPLRARGGGR